jgi:hypothetical protein
MRATACIFILCFTLSLGACGGDSSDETPKNLPGLSGNPLSGKQGGASPFGPGGISAADLVSVLQNAGQVELTDVMMEKYVSLLGELKKAGASPTEAWMRARSMDWKQWIAISTVIGGSASHVAISEQLASTEKRLADVRRKLEAAGEAQRPAFESMARGYSKQLEALRKMPGATDLDRKNQTLL